MHIVRYCLALILLIIQIYYAIFNRLLAECVRENVYCLILFTYYYLLLLLLTIYIYLSFLNIFTLFLITYQPFWC